MINFNLRCASKHEFQASFPSSDAYEQQKKDKLLQCPYCDDANIEKALQLPNLKAKSNSANNQLNETSQMPTKVATQVAMMQKFTEYVEKNCDDVGENFAIEARKIHYGDSDKKGVYGTATKEELTELAKDKIEFMPLPTPKEKKN